MALDSGQVEELIIEEVYEDEIEPEDKDVARDVENDMEEGEISGEGNAKKHLKILSINQMIKLLLNFFQRGPVPACEGN